jgi:DNA helicase-2/ATP-dependent DNA helicase PcrA
MMESTAALKGRVNPLDSGAIDAMVKTARKIAHDYKHGFKETDPDNCKERGFRFYYDGINL